MKTAIKHENDEFLVIPLKHESVLIGHANPPRTPKPWESLSLTRHANPHGIPKPWAIAHENGQKTPKQRVSIIILRHVLGLTGHANPP